MNLGQLFNKLVELGIQADPRSPEELKRFAEVRKKVFAEAKDQAQRLGTDPSWDNPYGDTRLLYGQEDQPVKRVLVGIDIDGSEVLLADRWRERENPVDALIAHHPEGRGQVQLYQVIGMQEELLAAAGVPIHISQAIIEERAFEVRRNLLPLNHQKTVDLARLLDIPLLCVHSPADNQVQQFLTDYLLVEKNFQDCKHKLGDVVEALLELPEFKLAAGHGVTPLITAGEKKNKTGKIYLKMNGGTSGPEQSIEELVKAGVGTIICMHLPESQRKKAKEHHLHVVIAGHMACDSVGMNLLMDKVEEAGVEVIACGGFLRHRRA